jgi:DNA polymerase III subunit delta'
VNVPGIVLQQASESQLDILLQHPSHAVLLTGPKGNGKTHIATTLAGALLRRDDPTTYAYFRMVHAQKGSITIEQIRELIQFFRLKVPGTDPIRRVAIIQDGDTMGREAQNALLKLLEEPPADSVLILTSSYPQGLLTTIRSRLQDITIAHPGAEMLTKYFSSVGYDTAAIRAALLRSPTDTAAAASLLADEKGADGNPIELVKRALSGSSYDRLLLVDPLSKQREAALQFVDSLSVIASASLESAATKGSTTMGRWSSILQAANMAQDALERSGNTKLVLTDLMLHL